MVASQPQRPGFEPTWSGPRSGTGSGYWERDGDREKGHWEPKLTLAGPFIAADPRCPAGEETPASLP